MDMIPFRDLFEADKAERDKRLDRIEEKIDKLTDKVSDHEHKQYLTYRKAIGMLVSVASIIGVAVGVVIQVGGF